MCADFCQKISSDHTRDIVETCRNTRFSDTQQMQIFRNLLACERAQWQARCEKWSYRHVTHFQSFQIESS